MSREIKFRNKITGEILAEEKLLKKLYSEKIWTVSLIMRFMEDWEEIEAPKGWYINMYGDIGSLTKGDEPLISYLKEIGNYFETKEEAEKAVEKLKAFKRLKDKGIKNIAWDWHKMNNPYREDDGKIYIKVLLDTETYDCSWDDDLDLLFGGEDDN